MQPIIKLNYVDITNQRQVVKDLDIFELQGFILAEFTYDCALSCRINRDIFISENVGASLSFLLDVIKRITKNPLHNDAYKIDVFCQEFDTYRAAYFEAANFQDNIQNQLKP